MTSSDPKADSVQVAGLEIDLVRDELRALDGAHIELRPRSFAVLRLLAGNAGHLVSKDEIMSAVWDDVAVTEDSLTQCIADIRRVLQDDERRIVRTVPRRGYLLVPDASPATRDAMPVGEIGPQGLSTPDAGSGAAAVAPVAWRGRPALFASLVAAVVLLLGGVALFGPSHTRAFRELPGRVPDRPTVAVLPFKAVVPSPNNDILAVGLASEIVNELARNKDVKVIGRASSFALGQQNLTPQEIGARLRVRYLVDGTVQRQDDRLSIDVHLVDTRDGTIALGESLRGGAELIGTMEPRISSKITGVLLSGLRQKETDALLRRTPRDLDVYELTLQGIAMTRQLNVNATIVGRRGLEEALRRDPEYGPAWAAYCWLNLADALNQFTGEWSRERLDEIIAQCNRAIELDPFFTRAYTGLSRAWMFKGDLDQGLRLIRRAVEIGPNDADILLFLAWTLAQKDELPEALQTAEAALDFNPIRPPYVLSHYAQILWAARRFDLAVEQTEACIRMAPKLPFCHIYQVLSLLESGRREQAEAVYRSALLQIPNLEKAIFSVIPPGPGLNVRFRKGFMELGSSALN